VGEKTAGIETVIREWIASGQYGPGDKIPSERVISQDLGAGRTTVRLVLVKLVAEGLLRPQHGAGYFVAGEKVPEDG
jgi:DNA-binding GntR family transcriptional regulator